MIFNEPALSHTYQLLRDGAFITMQNIISLNIVHVVFKFNVIIIFKDEIKKKCFNLKKKKIQMYSFLLLMHGYVIFCGLFC